MGESGPSGMPGRNQDRVEHGPRHQDDQGVGDHQGDHTPARHAQQTYDQPPWPNATRARPAGPWSSDRSSTSCTPRPPAASCCWRPRSSRWRWANSPFQDSYTDLWHTHLSISLGDHSLDLDLQEWVNDGLMAIFFFVVGLEIKRELVEGELREPRRAAMPAIAARRGHGRAGADLHRRQRSAVTAPTGWGIPMATDIAMAVGVLSLLGSRVALVAEAVPAGPRHRRRHRRHPRHRRLLLRRTSISAHSALAAASSSSSWP